MKQLLLGSLLIFASSYTVAASITCGNQYRTATLGSAEVCEIGSGNTQGNGSTIDGHFGASWSEQGSLTDNGSNSYLSSNLTSGSWGSQNVAGSWEIDSSFWDVFDEAVISIHVGNGSYDPDHFAWLITEDEISGNWSYDKLTGNGGGLSNMKLWGRVSAQVPEPGTLSLFTLGLLGLTFSRKKLNG